MFFPMLAHLLYVKCFPNKETLNVTSFFINLHEIRNKVCSVTLGYTCLGVGF